jgi:hypothetical protein
MPGKGTKASKAARRSIVARGKVAGAPTRKIAQAARCSERHVERLAAEPETALEIRELLKPHTDRLKKSLVKALDAIDRGLTAKKKTPHDHEVQLRAAGRLGEFLTLTKGEDHGGEGGRKFQGTFEELLVLYRQVTADAGGGENGGRCETGPGAPQPAGRRASGVGAGGGGKSAAGAANVVRKRGPERTGGDRAAQGGGKVSGRSGGRKGVPGVRVGGGARGVHRRDPAKKLPSAGNAARKR